MRHLKYLLILTLAVSLLALTKPLPASAMSPETLIALTNQQRAAAGLQPLHENADLMASAAAKAQDMLANNYWAHISPSGTSPWYFINQSGYKYRGAGENLAMDFGSEGEVMTGWMNSPSHRANILNPAYEDVGIAEVEGQLQGHDTILVVAHYGIPVQTAAPAPTESPVAPVVAVASVAASSTAAKPNSSVLDMLKSAISQTWLASLFKHGLFASYAAK